MVNLLCQMSLEDGMFSNEYYLNSVHFILTCIEMHMQKKTFNIPQEDCNTKNDIVIALVIVFCIKNDKVACLDSEINMSCINYVEDFTDVCTTDFKIH